MLCLTRKVDDEILIGEGPEKIVVTVTRIRGNQVQIGICAPRHVAVLRGELPPDDHKPREAA